MSGWPRPWRWWWAGLTALAFLGVLRVPWVLRARECPRSGTCLSHEKQIVLELLRYAQAHEGLLPEAETWAEELGLRDRNRRALLCPSQPRGRQEVVYALAPQYAGRPLNAITDPARTILLYETAHDLPAFPHRGGMHTGYADGHVKWLNRQQFDAHGVQVGGDWTPPGTLLRAVAEGRGAWVKLLLFFDASLGQRTASGRGPLHLAARTGRADLVQVLLDREAHVGDRDRAGLTPLHLAALYGDPVTVSLLLKQRAAVNARDSRGRTPLLLALRAWRVQAAELLLAAGADAGLAPVTGRGTLHYAVENHLTSLLPALLQAGASPTVADEYGVTPLHLAAADDRYAAEVLLQAGASAQATDVGGRTPLHYAATSRQRGGAALDLLTRAGGSVNARDRQGETPLLLAVRAGNVSVARTLLKLGAQPQLADRHGSAPLVMAVKQRNTELVRLLLESGASANVKASGGETVLQVAWRLRDTDLARLLVTHGAKLGPMTSRSPYDVTDYASRETTRLVWGEAVREAQNRRDEAAIMALLKQGLPPNYQEYRSGPTLLTWAIEQEHVALVRELLCRGVPAVPRERYGMEPLWRAAHEGNLEIARLLLARGATATANCLRGAVDGGHPAMVRLLLAHGAPPQEAVETAVRGNRVAALRLLLQRGAKLPPPESYGRTLLHVAAEQGHGEMTRFLLQRGLSPTVPDAGGNPPSWLAAEAGHRTVVQLLVQAGAPLGLPEALALGREEVVQAHLEDRIRLTQPWGRYTPAQWALRYDRLDLVGLMVKKGAPLTLELACALGDRGTAYRLMQSRFGYDSRGVQERRPLEWAAYYGHRGIVADLLRRGVGVKRDHDSHSEALRLALARGYQGVADLLQKHGATVYGMPARGSQP